MTPELRDCREFEFVEIEPALLLRGDGNRLEIDRDSESRGAFSIDVRGGYFRVQAGGFVGVVPINSRVSLRIRPRAPLANMDQILRASGHTPLQIGSLRTYGQADDLDDWLFDVYASYLEPAIESLIGQGILRTYRRHHDAGSSPRGRIDFGGTMRRHVARNAPFVAEYNYFERTPDNDPNRVIKLALLRLHRHYVARRSAPRAGDRQHIRRLGVLLAAFADVSEPTPQSVLVALEVVDPRRIPDERFYYREVVSVAANLVSERGITFDRLGSDVRLSSLLIDMKDVFERYLRNTLTAAAAMETWPLSVLDGNHEGLRPLYVVPTPIAISLFGPDLIVGGGNRPPDATPDIVLRDGAGSTRLVVEVKYTQPKSALPSRDELDQALTYASTHGTRVIVLVHPRLKGGSAGLQFVGVVGDINVFDYRFDLAAGDLKAEEVRWCQAIRELAEINVPQSA